MCHALASQGNPNPANNEKQKTAETQARIFHRCLLKVGLAQWALSKWSNLPKSKNSAHGCWATVFADAGMEPDMQLGLYLALFANTEAETEMELGLYIWVRLHMQEWPWIAARAVAGRICRCRNGAGNAARAVFGRANIEIEPGSSCRACRA